MLKVDQHFVTVPDLPEQTGRTPDGTPAGHILESASTWVPRSLIPYPEPLIQSGTFYGEARGATITIQLVEERGDFLVMPRHLATAALPRFTGRSRLVSHIQWDEVYYEDHVTPRDPRQERAWAALSQARCGILSIACGGGKTTLACKKIAQQRVPALIIVNSEMLMEQWIDAAKQFLHLEDCDIGVVRGPTAQWDRPFVVGMIQTMAQRVEDIPTSARQRFGIVVFDEVHHLSAPQFSQVADVFYGMRLGLSATPGRSDKLEGVYFAHLGPLFYVDTETELPSDVFFKAMSTEAPPKSRIFSWNGDLQIANLYGYLAEDLERNRLIAIDAADAAAAGRKVLVLSHGIDHTEELARVIRLTCNKTVGVVTSRVLGKDKGAKRLAILRDSQITCATFNIAKEGLNVPSIDTVLFATPFKDWGAFTQAKGRAERAHPNKLPPLVVLYEDTKIEVCVALFRKIKRGLKDNGLTFRNVKP